MSAEILNQTPTSGDYPEKHFGQTFNSRLWIKFTDNNFQEWVGCFNRPYQTIDKVLINNDNETAFVVAGGQEEKLFAVEEKWINNEINKDTYDRWHSIYNDNVFNLKGAIERLSNDQSQAFSILEGNLNLLTDMRYVYCTSDTLQKRQFVNLVFDSNLYYENGVYRTPTMMRLLSHHHLIMREKKLLIYEKKEGLQDEAPPSG